MTREHRENLAKLAKQFSNKSKDSLRRVRSGALSQLKKAKEGVSEDTVRIIEKQVRPKCRGSFVWRLASPYKYIYNVCVWRQSWW